MKILVKGSITVAGNIVAWVAFKNCEHFIKCITKIDDAEDLDLVMPMYNLLKYNSNYSNIYKVYGFIQRIKQLILIQIL